MKALVVESVQTPPPPTLPQGSCGVSCSGSRLQSGPCAPGLWGGGAFKVLLALLVLHVEIINPNHTCLT